MASDREEKLLNTKVGQNQSLPPSNVRFHLEESQSVDDFDGSLDEVDEFLELSTYSNPQSTSSFGSSTNDTTSTTKIPLIDSSNNESKPTPKRYPR
jgi:hypothetical protein